MPAIIVTLAASFIIGGAALLILPRPGGAIPAWFSDTLAGDTPVAAILLILTIVVWKIYLAAPIGLSLYAAGENPVAAYRAGVPVDAARIAAYAFSGLLTTCAGVFIAAQTGSGDPVIGEGFTLNSIAAAVLGGVGFLGGQGAMRGAVAGSLLLSLMISVMYFLGFPPVTHYIAQGLIIIGAVAISRDHGARGATVSAAESSRFPRRRAVTIVGSRPFLTALIVAAVWIAASFARPGFGSFGHLRYLFELASVVGLVAIGQTFVVIAGGIDLSVGAIVTVSAVSVPLVAFFGDATGAIAVVVILAAATGIGTFNGLGVAYLRVHPMIMTLAMATFLQGVLILIAGGSAVSAQNPLLAWLGNARPAGVPAGVILWAIASATALVALHATPFGARVSRSAPIRSLPRYRASTSRRRPSRFTPSADFAAVSPAFRAGHERSRLCRDRRSLPARLDRCGGSGRNLDHRRLRHLRRHDPRRDPAGDDHRPHHRGQRLAGVAQHPVRIAHPGAPVALRRELRRR